MRCPACATDNPAESAACSSCGQKLGKPARRRTPNFNDQYSLIASRVPRNRAAVLAYRCAVIGLVPGAGLALGGVAIVLGVVGRRRFYADPESRGLGHAVAAIALGILEVLTNGAGLACVWIGLQSLPG